MEIRFGRWSWQDEDECVFKCRLYYYKSMARPIDHKMITIEKRDFNSQFPREWGMPCHTGPHEEAPGLIRRHRE